ncbi:MAG: SMC-Scp complex subunit ScpB [Gammaproteobacteria bacterium]|jgi:segregation and condensation protein B
MSDEIVSDDLKNIIEAVLLASDSPVNVSRIQGLFDKNVRPEAVQIHQAIEALQVECENRGVELKKIGSGYRYQTREKYAQYLRKLHQAKPPRMSRALLETLAIIAYRQPVTRGDIEEVRGVSVSPEIMQRLIEREWVKQIGVRDVPGRPALFGTTPEFLSYFNLASLKDLPDLMEERSLGEIAGEMETPLPMEIIAAMENSETNEQASNAPELSAEEDALSDQAPQIEDLSEEEEDDSSFSTAGGVPSDADDAKASDELELEQVFQQEETASEIKEADEFPAVKFDAG